MTITDLAFADGELLIAGLSNTEFASTLRRAAFPFKQTMAVNTLEIFHTSHDKYETQSPIESFLPFTISGKPSLLAGYGCAPIASFTLADLKTKQHLRGTTLAELGGGNRPLDMIAFTKDGQRRVLIANSDRTLMSMSAKDIEKATPMTKAVDAAYVSAGVPYLSIAEIGITQLDNLNDRIRGGGAAGHRGRLAESPLDLEEVAVTSDAGSGRGGARARALTARELVSLRGSR